MKMYEKYFFLYIIGFKLKKVRLFVRRVRGNMLNIWEENIIKKAEELDNKVIQHNPQWKMRRSQYSFIVNNIINSGEIIKLSSMISRNEQNFCFLLLFF